MITGIRINLVEARRDKDEDIKGLDINIGIDNVKVTGPEVEVAFSYTATYQDGVGTLKMTGSLLSHEDAAMARKIKEEWERPMMDAKGKPMLDENGNPVLNRKLPDEFSELVLNAINFTCGTNGVLVVRPVNLAPPMVPPRIQLSSGGAGAGTEQPPAPSGRRGRGAQ